MHKKFKQNVCIKNPYFNIHSCIIYLRKNYSTFPVNLLHRNAHACYYLHN